MTYWFSVTCDQGVGDPSWSSLEIFGTVTSKANVVQSPPKWLGISDSLVKPHWVSRYQSCELKPQDELCLEEFFFNRKK